MVFNALQSKEDVSDSDIAAANNFTGNYITILDDNYPERFKASYRPPFIIYYDGDVSLLSRVTNKNDLIFLHGPNTFNFSSDRLVTITEDYKIDMCGCLKIWFNKNSDNVCRFALAAKIAHNLCLTKQITSEHSWFYISVNVALELGGNVFVVPGSIGSRNNTLIQSGAMLLNFASDVDSYRGV